MDRIKSCSWLEPKVFIGFGLGLMVGYLIRRFNMRPAVTSTLRTAFTAMKKPKMVLVVRSDLGMGKGKMAAQCCHAAVSCYKKAIKSGVDELQAWEMTGCAKVALKVDGEDALFELMGQARKLGLITSVIQDAGHTQVTPGTVTVLGIGPGQEDLVNQVTGHLKLL